MVGSIEQTLTSEPAAHAGGIDHARRIEELGRIIMAYSEVTEKLQQSHDQLKGQVEQLRRELGEKNRLLERRKRLAALGEMAAGLAHEIRNPLGGIQLYASILSQDVADRPASQEVVRKISGGVKRLESLVSQTLQFTREIKVQTGPMDFAAVVAQAIELAEHQRAAKGIEFDVGGPQTLHAVADANLLGQCVLNLLLNAVEATGSDRGRVKIRFGLPQQGSDYRQLFFSVADSGPGIAASAMDKIFDPFFTTKDTGTGLGLSIVHRIVEGHDGTISAVNCDGGGAKFEIRI